MLLTWWFLFVKYTFSSKAPCCAFAERKHRAEPLLSLKKPFNLGFKAFPGREFNLRDLRFSMLGVCILSVGFSIPSPPSQPENTPPNTAVTTKENTPPRAATNTVNKQCWPDNPTSRRVNYSVNKSNMLFCFSQVCGRLQQRERFLQQAKRVQVSKTTNKFDKQYGATIWGGQESVRREIWSMASDPCHRGVRWFTCPPWLPSGPSSPDNLTGWKCSIPALSCRDYHTTPTSNSPYHWEDRRPAISHDREIQSGRSGEDRSQSRCVSCHHKPNPTLSSTLSCSSWRVF